MSSSGVETPRRGFDPGQTFHGVSLLAGCTIHERPVADHPFRYPVLAVGGEEVTACEGNLLDEVNTPRESGVPPGSARR
jgi:hypothetical protein